MSTAKERLVVVGASLAGLRAIEAARTEGYRGEITLIGEEIHAPYDRPPLSKAYLEGATHDTTFRELLTLTDELGTTLRLGETATGLDVAQKEVHTDRGSVPYTDVIIATGSSPRRMPGAESLAGVYVLRTIDDAMALRREVRPGTRVVVIGAGFIGSEVASSCKKIGAEVTIVEAAPVPLARAVGAMGSTLTSLHSSHGVQVRIGVAVQELLGTDRIAGVRLADGTVLEADVLVVGIGSSPATSWLHDSGLELHALDKGIVCDATLAASAPGVWAAGDVAHWYNGAFKSEMRLENWTNAAQQGAHAARNVALGTREAYATVPYYWSDWYEHRIQFVGIPTADEVHIASGSIDEGRLIALYRKEDRIVGALTVRQPRQIMKLRALIEQRASWDQALELAAHAQPVTTR